jgi:leucyl aminopeptidase
VREFKKLNDLLKIEKLGFWHSNADEAARAIRLASAIEIGRIVARDIGGSDPERMCASNVQAYIEDIFKSTDIKVINFNI